MQVNKKIISLSVLMMLLLSSTSAYANGIPVIFAVTVFHVLFINIIVIAAETFLLKKLSKQKVAFGFIVLANFASIFLAYILTDSTISSALHAHWFGLEAKGKIEKRFFLSGVFVFILLTILIEWPFFYLAQKGKRSGPASLKYSAIINLITNIPIAAFYFVNELYYDLGD